MAVGRTIARCILRWIYDQIAAVLEALKLILLAAIQFIDAQILWLRALLAQYDVLAIIEEAAWSVFEALVQAIRDTLTAFPEGPFADLCPEFYRALVDPLVQLSDINTSALTVWRERYKTMISYVDELDYLISYWDAIKTDLVATVEVIDDAIYLAKIREAEETPT